MNNPDSITFKAFREKLLENPEFSLQFQYGESVWVKPSYHITELKQATISSVDCGGKFNSWTEIIVQLLEPAGKLEQQAMTAGKALSIIRLVERSLDLNPEAEVKIEFGNSKFETRQMYPAQITIEGENLIVDLKTQGVQCKAMDRNGNCGTDSSCCTDQQESTDQRKELIVAQTSCCTPGGGCC